MSFWESSQEVRLEETDQGHVLFAKCLNGSDEWCDSQINLNEHLGNNNGEFERGSGGFSQSSALVRLEGPEIVCLLYDGDNNPIERRINLNEFVGNDNGQLVIQ